ncbi:hypothetical protein SmJEL517_g00176 [Synchytrium microbalum]|uniref:CSC1/OSCA1-like 7TM region domain-containing protein n=1 Tax=Synchytrium microbalum TaxID=1806994 RepID=A0A507CJ94_9FUNG|nr:uncharacterized protein SmJEL517_g00176 [Synchytrium microbalum]TPX38346.1 hypothetical protein SmJEL517_g00176 [Synchytrium microbalum]
MSTNDSYCAQYVANVTVTANSSLDFKGVLVQFLLQLAISAGFLIAFSFVRFTNKYTYQTRALLAPDEKKPRKLGKFPLAWVVRAFTDNETKDVNKIGMDAVMYLRFVRLCAHVFLTFTILGIPLMGFYYHSPDFAGAPLHSNVNGQGGITFGSINFIPPSLNQLTLANLNQNSPFLWLPAAAAWIFSFILYGALAYEYHRYTTLRQLYFHSPTFTDSYSNRTVLLTNIPHKLQSDTALARYVESLDVGVPIAQALVGRNVSSLAKLVKLHQKTTAKLEKVLFKYLAQPDRPSESRPTMRIKGGRRVDAIAHLGNRLHRLEEEIYAMRSKSDDSYVTNASGFISFETAYAAQVATKALRNGVAVRQKTKMIAPPDATLSPSFDSILWDNIGITRPIRHSRQILATVLLLGLTIAWFFVGVFIAWITSLDNIQKYLPAVAASIRSSEAGIIFVTSVFSPFLYYLANWILPNILDIISNIQGVASKSGQAKSTLNKFFAFQVYQSVFVVSFSALWAIISAWVHNECLSVTNNDPTGYLVRQAAIGLSSNSTFYIAVIIASVTGYAFEIFQGVKLIKVLYTRIFASLTPRKEFELSSPPTFQYATQYGGLLITFLLALIYSIIAPLVLPFALIFYGIAYIVMKYQMYWVYGNRFESGGTWWPKIFRLCVISIFVFQFFTFAVYLLTTAQADSGNNSARSCTIFLAILPFLSIIYYIITERYYLPKSEYMTLHHSEEQEAARSHKLERSSTKLTLADRAFHPAMAAPLPIVWVNRKQAPYLASFYSAMYDDFTDYLRKKISSIHGAATIEDAGLDSRNIKRLRVARDASRDDLLLAKDEEVVAKQEVAEGILDGEVTTLVGEGEDGDMYPMVGSNSNRNSGSGGRMYGDNVGSTSAIGYQ